MKKILVIGSSGAGKSVFSRRLGGLTGLPVIHLDQHYWRPEWTEPDKGTWRAQVEDLLKRDSWIIDGNYGGTMELRLASCDTVIFLDISRYICTWRVLKRAVRYRGRNRPDLAGGCSEKIDIPFLRWTWDYPARSRPAVLERLSRLPASVPIVTLKTNRDVESFLASFK